MAGWRIILTAMIAVAADGVLRRIKATPQSSRKNCRKPEQSCRRSAAIARADWTFCSRIEAAPDEASAKHVEARIWARGCRPDDTAALLIDARQGRDGRATGRTSRSAARRCRQAAPDYVEDGTGARRYIYLKNDYAHFVEDIEQYWSANRAILAPLAGLGMIMAGYRRRKRALDAFRKALAVNPHLEKVPELSKP